MSDFLTKMAVLQKARVEHAQKTISVQDLRIQIATQPQARGFKNAILNKQPGIIAEVKFASPSAGRIYQGGQTATDIAQGYMAGGAAVLSVLTEPDYFQGSREVFSAIRMHVPDACLLRKDFMVDAYQILEARAWGADAVLLIVAMLSDQQLIDMYSRAQDLGMDVLVEVHDADELARAHTIGAQLIGVNNRNLKTLVVDPQTSAHLSKDFIKGPVYISESGIEDPAILKTLQGVGYKGFLIGSHFMRHNNPQTPLMNLVQACQ